MSEWISVKERSPEGTCLVYAPDKDKRRTEFHVGVYHENVTIIGGHFEFDMPDVTHWQPLPPPPGS